MRTRFAILMVLIPFLLAACSLPAAPEPGGGASATPLLSETPAQPSATLPPTASPTQPLQTDEPVSTREFDQPPVESPSPTTPPPTPTPEPPFILQPGTPLGTSNFVEPEAGCNWMGVGGQALDLKRAPARGLVVEVGGTLNGREVSYLAITGGAPVFGPGGYLVELASQPIASDGSLWLRLLDASGEPLSKPIYFTTFAECERNLVLVNLVEITTGFGEKVYMPWVRR